MSDSALLTVQGISAGYGKKLVIKDISFDVHAGEIVALCGSNGAGKTTALRAVSGLIPLASGKITVEGKELSSYSLSERARIISLCATDREKIGRMKSFEVVSLGRYPYTGRFGRLSDEDLAKVFEAMKLTGVYEYENTEFAGLSDGLKQLVLLARAFAQDSKLLILDEPASFLDISHKLMLMEALKKWVKLKHAAALASLHELELAAQAADRVICISKEGSIGCMGSPKEVFSDEMLSGLFGVPEGKIKKLYGDFAKAL